LPADKDPSARGHLTAAAFLPRYAVTHDMVTGLDAYRKPMLEWASAVDEASNLSDQMMANVLVAAHFYDGNPEWLTRAYAMALRTAATAEANDEYHQCNARSSRQGTRFLMEFLYAPILAASEWGTRGNRPVTGLQHRLDDRDGLPRSVAFRTWRIDAATDGFEALNRSSRPVRWTLDSAAPDAGDVRVEADGRTRADTSIKLSPGGRMEGRLVWRRHTPSE